MFSWSKALIENSKRKIEANAIQLLCDALGTDLERIRKEIDKLCNLIPEGETISSQDIQKYMGISREFNNFELQKAIADNDFEKALKIINYFTSNPKENPFVLSVSTLFAFFRRLLLYHGLDDKSKDNVARVLGVNSFFVDEYRKAANHYEMRRVSAIVNAFRDLDIKSKGVGAGQLSHADLLKEILIQVFSKF